MSTMVISDGFKNQTSMRISTDTALKASRVSILLGILSEHSGRARRETKRHLRDRQGRTQSRSRVQYFCLMVAIGLSQTDQRSLPPVALRLPQRPSFWCSAHF